MNWNLLRTGNRTASWNMALDEALLEQSSAIGGPILRLYGWAERAATFGYSQRYREVAEWTALRPLIRRPTGGGLVPHDADWTYSLVFPPEDRKSTRLNSSHLVTSYAVFCSTKKTK